MKIASVNTCSTNGDSYAIDGRWWRDSIVTLRGSRAGAGAHFPTQYGLLTQDGAGVRTTAETVSLQITTFGNVMKGTN